MIIKLSNGDEVETPPALQAEEDAVGATAAWLANECAKRGLPNPDEEAFESSQQDRERAAAAAAEAQAEREAKRAKR